MKSVLLTIVLLLGAALCHHGGRHDFGERRGGRHCPHMKPPPTYLQDVNQQAQAEYFAIVSNAAATIAQQNLEIKRWAEKYGISDKVQALNSQIEKMRDEMKRNVSRLITELPYAMVKHSLIMENENQTPIERHNAMQRLDATNPKLYNVLRFAIKQFMPHHGATGRGSQGSVYPGYPKNDRFGTISSPFYPENMDEIQGNKWMTDDEFRRFIGYNS